MSLFLKIIILLGCCVIAVAQQSVTSVDFPFQLTQYQDVLQLSAGADIKEVSLDGFDMNGQPVFSLQLYPSQSQSLKNKQGGLLPDGKYFCHATVTKIEGKIIRISGRLVKSLGQMRLASGVALFNEGHYDDALQTFKQATEAFPQEPLFWMHLAATQFRKLNENSNEEFKAKAEEALNSYLRALALAQDCLLKDNAYGYIATLYGDMLNSEAKRLEWLLKRADDGCADPHIKAQTFYSIGVRYWQCAYDLSTHYANKKLEKSAPFHTRHFRLKADQVRFDDCVVKAFEFLDKAITLRPDYGEAYSYKSLLFREKQKRSANRIERNRFEREAKKTAKTAIDLTVQATKKAESENQDK